MSVSIEVKNQVMFVINQNNGGYFSYIVEKDVIISEKYLSELNLLLEEHNVTFSEISDMIHDALSTSRGGRISLNGNVPPITSKEIKAIEDNITEYILEEANIITWTISI